MKAAAGALLALALGGCDVLVEECVDGCIDWVFLPDHGLEVANGGGAEARVEASWEEWVDEDEEDATPGRYETRVRTYDLAPGEKETRWYGDVGVSVKITRRADGGVLFEDHFSGADFERENDRIELTVYP